MSEEKNYAGTVVEVGAPERSKDGQKWKPSALKVRERGGDFVKTFRVWPYQKDSDSHTDAYQTALNNKDSEVTLTYKEGGFQGEKDWVTQYEVIAISGPNSTSQETQDWPAVTSTPPTEGTLSVAEGAVLDAQAALKTALNAIRQNQVSAEF